MKNIHVLPTDKLIKNVGDLVKDQYGNIHIFTKNDGKEYGKTTTKFNISITNDEKIKEGDWCLDKFNQRWKLEDERLIAFDSKGIKRFSTDNILGHDCKKITLTTDQDLIKDGVQSIDDEFLEWFVKNPSCDEVEVVKESYGICNSKDDRCYCYTQIDEHNCPNFIKEYKIIIPKEKPKTVFDQLEVGKDYKQEVFELGEEPKQDYNYIIEFGKYLLIKYDGLKSVEEHFKQFKNK